MGKREKRSCHFLYVRTSHSSPGKRFRRERSRFTCVAKNWIPKLEETEKPAIRGKRFENKEIEIEKKKHDGTQKAP